MEASGPRACRVNRKEPSEVAATKSLIARAKAGKDPGSKLAARNLKLETTTNDKRPNVSNNLDPNLSFGLDISSNFNFQIVSEFDIRNFEFGRQG
jgi:hypothetical protein